MISALCLIHGVMLAQAPVPAGPPAAPSRIASLLPPQVVDELPASDRNATTAPIAPPPGPPAAAATPDQTSNFSIFSRPFFSDRNGLSFVTGAGAGRFNIIDWESRPNSDRFWWLGRWSVPDDVQFYLGLGFNIHWWAGPVQDPAAQVPHLPAQVFDLYLDWSWSQRWSDRLTSEVRLRPGLYTDFRTTPPDAFRIPGEAALVYEAGPGMFLVGGIQHLQRIDIQVLPIVGILCQPTSRWELSLVFPEPKIAYELSTSQRLWGYVAAEYGGGRWAYKNDAGGSEHVEYSDFRAVFGVEWRDVVPKNVSFLAVKALAFFEVGYVFERYLRFASRVAQFEPESAWMIRFGTVW